MGLNLLYKAFDFIYILMLKHFSIKSQILIL